MNRVAVIDVETGGLDPNEHSILSLTIAIVTERFELLEEMTWFIKQDVYHVTAGALKVNLIDIAQADAWIDADLAKRRIVEFLKMPETVLTPKDIRSRDKWRIVGKNPNFDKGFLEAFFGKVVYNNIFMHWTECVFREMFLPLQRIGMFPRSRSGTLTEICKTAGINVDETQTHSSQYDVALTVELARICIEKEDVVKRLIAAKRAERGAPPHPAALPT